MEAFLSALGAAVLLCCGALPAQGLPPGGPAGPLAPDEAARSFRLAAGFHIRLAASEPLIAQPTGLCWDEHGRLFVCELRGYNLEGQLEVDAAEKAGAPEEASSKDAGAGEGLAAEKFRIAARAGASGSIKLLRDADGDGILDAAGVLADDLPPVYGICPARGGLIAACAPEIVFLADRDGDGKAEVREVLFTGFAAGRMDRRINSPRWGPGGWIYFGGDGAGGKIASPRLGKSVELGAGDFRIRSDGSALEPVTGGGSTFGLAFTEEGDRFFTSSWKHALYAAPLERRYLDRNPFAPPAETVADAADYHAVFPIAAPQPWRVQRSGDPAWKERHEADGIPERAAGGFFTSCCSPLVYRDGTFPPEHRGNLFVCEPAQSLVHRSIIERRGPEFIVRRAPGEENTEFLASADPWFRPVALASGPDGAIWVADMYREIIESYASVPRFLRRQYGLRNGGDRGRIWRIAPDSPAGAPLPPHPPPPQPDMARLDEAGLARELESPTSWRRETAARLLRERGGKDKLAAGGGRLGFLDVSTPPALALEILRSADENLAVDAASARRVALWSRTLRDERLLLQAALSLGYSRDPEAFQAMVRLARESAGIRWMPAALLSGLQERAGAMLGALLADPGPRGAALLGPLAAAVAARRDEGELEECLAAIAAAVPEERRRPCLEGLASALRPGPLSPRALQLIEGLLPSPDLAVRGLAVRLLEALEPRSRELAEYFPPPESSGGWRKLDDAGVIRGAGMDPGRLASLREWLLQSDDRDFAAVVIRRGSIVLEVERGNSSRTDARRVASVSKAVCATVLAIASEESLRGGLPLTMRFGDAAFRFIPWAQPLSDPRKQAITVRQLLNHTSGICPEATGAPNDGSWEYILGRTGDPRTSILAFDPGSGCGYSTHALAHAALVCESVAGMPYDRYAIRSLFKPIGCERWWFQEFGGGAGIGSHPSHGLGMPARDLARIGYCMLRGGRWGGAQVIPRWFVEETSGPTHGVQGPEMRFKIESRTFSHGWEVPALLGGAGERSGEGIPADARYKPGSGGQLLAFVPSLDLVIARQTGSSGDWQYQEFLRRACAAALAGR